ncbi:isoprenoid synthase domain-containing protein, partial [Mycena polygramma]
LELPDIHDRWPFPVAYNRWEATTSLESIAWIESLCILSARRLEQFKAANFGGLASITYSHFTEPLHYRVACDFVNLLFVFDDVTDELTTHEVQCLAELSLDALRNPEKPRPAGEHRVGEMHRSFSKRLHFVANAEVLGKFILNYDAYLGAVVDEASDRDHRQIRSSLDAYLALRRETGAVTCCFDLLLLQNKIPAGLLKDSSLKHLETLGLDLICIGNDILSFNAEYARGDTHNAVIVVMHERRLSIQDAMNFVGEWYREHLEEFCTVMRDLPPCRSVVVRDRLRMYVAGIVNWVTGNYEWSLRSGRYFPAGQDPVEGGWVIPLLGK